MIKKIDAEVFTACENGDFLNASKKFVKRCKNDKDCLCRDKDLKDISMCMISHMQYFTMMEDEKLSEEILESYVSWRARTKQKSKETIGLQTA